MEDLDHNMQSLSSNETRGKKRPFLDSYNYLRSDPDDTPMKKKPQKPPW